VYLFVIDEIKASSGIRLFLIEEDFLSDKWGGIEEFRQLLIYNFKKIK
jgi:hypothetical protein